MSKQAYDRAWYRKHRGRVRPKRNEQKVARRKVHVEAVRAHKALFGYADCGEGDPVVLELDHTEDNKRDNVSDMISQGLGLASIMAEVQKCDVVCANCHRRRTHQRMICT